MVISTRPGDPPGEGLGRVVEGGEIRLADEDGLPVPEGRPGRLWIRSDSNTTGYWRRSELTRDVVYGPWLRMGAVLMQTGGVYRHLGRADALFKVDALWVRPTAGEAALMEEDGGVDAGGGGLPDPEGLVHTSAFVVVGPDADAGADALTSRLRRAVAHRLGHHAAPRTITAVDRLPRLPSGKLDRRSLRLTPAPGTSSGP